MTRNAAGRIATTATLILATFIFAAPVRTFAAAPEPAAFQDRVPAQRIVHGKVEDKSGAGVKGAVVYLKDSRTASVKSAIADDDGTYRFVQLTQNTDYELWAQLGEKRSKTRAISSFDSKNEFNIDLTIDR